MENRVILSRYPVRHSSWIETFHRDPAGDCSTGLEPEGRFSGRRSIPVEINVVIEVIIEVYFFWGGDIFLNGGLQFRVEETIF